MILCSLFFSVVIDNRTNWEVDCYYDYVAFYGMPFIKEIYILQQNTMCFVCNYF